MMEELTTEEMAALQEIVVRADEAADGLRAAVVE
jgi:hypothetical protein